MLTRTSEMAMKSQSLFLTGEPGVGKSTIVQAVKARLAAAVQAVGFYTIEKLDEDGNRVGFLSVDVSDPASTVKLATLEKNAGHGAYHQQRFGPIRHLHCQA